MATKTEKPKLPEGVREQAVADEPFSFIRAVQQIAMAGHLKPDVPAVYRKICRYYSKEFNTPLHEVEQLPIYDVLLHFYEDRYENMEAQERDDIKKQLARTKPERDALEAEKEDETQSDEEWIRQLEEQEAAKAKAKEPEEKMTFNASPIDW